MPSRITLLAGADALRIIRDRGLRAEDVDVVPAASGGPKWIVLHGIDRLLAGWLFAQRTRPLHVVGSSIGAWRLACLLQQDPLTALDRFREAYFAQSYPSRPPPEHVTRVSAGILDELLGPGGVDDIVGHPWARLHVITARARGLMASERTGVQMAGMALAAAANAVSRRWLGAFTERVVFHLSLIHI